MVAAVHSCRTATTTITARDTLTVTRDSVVYIHTRDTLTVTENRDRDVIKYVYDTAQRVREVVKIQYRDRIKTEQGAATVQIVRDTVTVQAGAQSTNTHTTKPARTVRVLGVGVWLLLFGWLLFVYFRYRKPP